MVLLCLFGWYLVNTLLPVNKTEQTSLPPLKCDHNEQKDIKVYGRKRCGSFDNDENTVVGCGENIFHENQQVYDSLLMIHKSCYRKKND